MNKISTTFLIIFVSILISSPVFAEEDEPRWYQIELILFSNKLAEESITENWPEFPGTGSTKNIIELVLPGSDNAQISPGGKTKVARKAESNRRNDSISDELALVLPFSVVDKDQYRLTVSAQKLERSSKYNLLLHISWRQPAFRSSDNSAIYLHDGLNEINKKPPTNEETITNPSGPEPERFFGTFKLTLSRFLHIDIDMIYRDLIKKHTGILATETEITGSESINNDPELQAQVNQDIYIDESTTYDARDFRLKTSRRVKPDEIHYFDHPLFGVITMVTRYELPKPEEEESPMQPFIP